MYLPKKTPHSHNLSNTTIEQHLCPSSLLPILILILIPIFLRDDKTQRSFLLVRVDEDGVGQDD